MMFKNFLRICSMILAIVLVLNLLPAQALAGTLFDTDQSLSATDETLSADASLSSATAQDAQIVEELAQKRTEYTKEFKLSNGLHMAVVYPEPVHYANDGQWDEIDNRLKATASGAYTNTAGLWQVALPQQLSASSPVTITKDSYTLSFALSGQLTQSSGAVVMSAQAELTAQQTADTFALTTTQTVTAQPQDLGIAQIKAAARYPEAVSDKLASRLMYENVYADTSVTYDLDSNKVKESIIMERYNANLRGYKYTLNVGSMVPVLGQDGHIDFYNEEKTEIVMVMPAPFLVDAANTYNDDIQVQLAGKGSTYTLTYILPQTWLAEESRQWPVILDPVVSATMSSSNIRDQQVTENTQYSHTRGVMEAGYGANDGIERFYIKYQNLPTLATSDVIVHAQLLLHKPNNYPSSAVIEVHKVLDTWESENLHWSNMPNFDSTIEDYQIVEDAGTYTWDVTDIARGWYEGQNTGMMFKASDEIEQAAQEKWMQFYSSDCGGSSGMPALSITFQNFNGLEDAWSYTSASAGRAGTGSVNNYTGSLVWVHGDIGFGGNRAPVSISHVYNSSDIGNTDRYGTSAGWKTNLNQRIYPSDDDMYYVWEDGDGTLHYLLKRQDGTIVDENDPDISLRIKGASDPTHYFRIDIKNGLRYHFDSMRRLTRIEDLQRESNNIDITYMATNSYKIATVADGVERLYTYNYNTDGLLSSIVYTGTGTDEVASVSFGYTGGKLTSMTDIDGQVSTYGYTGSLLTSATDPYGLKLEYTYSSTAAGKPNRVTEIKSLDGTTAGGEMSISYGHNMTTITDEVNGITQISHFNDFGNVISVQDQLGRAQHVGYTKMTKDDTGVGNQLTLSSKLQNTVKNQILTRHNFEHAVGTGSATVFVTDTEHYLGQKSMQVDAATASTAAFTVTAGETYTFSAWVKTGTKKAWLALDNQKSPVLEAGTDWTRLEVHYTATETKSIRPTLVTEGTGSVYMDCVQLEKTPTASRYNLIENGDFSFQLNYWTGSDYTLTSTASAAPQLDGNVIAVTGDPEAQQRLTQTLPISGAKGDSFVLAGWAKGDSAPLPEDDDQQRTFGVELTFNYTAEVEDPKDMAITFNPNTDGTNWQYAASPIVAEEAYSSVTVTITYDYNVNSAYFDGIQLFKEVFANSYTYDEDGNVISVENLQQQKTQYEYNANSELTKAILPTGAEVTYTYDDYHNVKTTTTAEGQTYRFEYDHYGNNTKVSITSGGQTVSSTATYTANGNYLASSTDALGNTTTYSYNADTGLLEWVQAPEDTNQTRTEYTYDPASLLLTGVNATTDTGLAMSASYTYTQDLLTRIQTPTTDYGFAYGVFNLRQSVTVGNGTTPLTLASYVYDDDKTDDGKATYLLERLDYGNGDGVQYSYDAYGRILSETYEDGDTVSYLYDNDGAIAQLTDSASGITTRYYYDLSGRAAGYSERGENFSHSVGYTYDDINNLAQLVEELNGAKITTSYTYDDDNRTTSITTDGTTVEYTYDSFGRVTQQVTKNGDTVVLTEVFTFKNPSNTATSGQVASYKTYKGAVTDANLIAQYAYTYDDNGNITVIEENGKKISYTYDTANQLIREDNEKTGKSHTWTYDNAGNILSAKTYAYATGDLTTATATETIPYTYGNTQWGDLLTAWNGTAITYEYQVPQTVTNEDGTTRTLNNIGNPAQIGDRSFEWEHSRQLKKLTDGTTAWNYTYNNTGLRTGRYVENGTSYTYIYSGSQLLQMTKDNQTASFTYDANGTPLTMKLGNNTYYYVTNIQGDIVALVNAAGETVVSYAYTAYGEVTITDHNESDSADINPLTYRGYVYDTETKLFYLQSRYYDPAVGRFINSAILTSTGQGLIGNNMFAYCLNNLVNSANPTGVQSKSISERKVDALANTLVSMGTVGAAPDFKKIPAAPADFPVEELRKSYPNCYSFAIQEYSRSYNPGDFSGNPVLWGSSVAAVADSVISDMEALGRGARIIDGYDAPIHPNEYRIAVRVGRLHYYENGKHMLLWDYHFMVQTSDGRWAEKHGPGGESIQHKTGNPDTLSWDFGSLIGFYNSPIIYLAVTE